MLIRNSALRTTVILWGLLAPIGVSAQQIQGLSNSGVTSPGGTCVGCTFVNPTLSGTVAVPGTTTFSNTVNLSPANKQITISPTGTGTLVSAPATAGSLDNLTLGVTTPLAVKSTTLIATGAVALSPASANVVISPTGTGLVTINPTTAGSIDNATLGITTPLAIKSTTLTATAAVSLSPANANDVLSPTGTGTVTISPATLGTLDNMTIGASTAGAANFSSIGATTRGTSAFTTGNFNSTLTFGDSATWGTTGLSDTNSYATSSTAVALFNPIWNFSSTANGISPFALSSTMIPTGVSAGNISNLAASATAGTSNVNIASFRSINSAILTASGYSGIIADAIVFRASANLAGTNPLTTYTGFSEVGESNGNGITTGTVTNNSFASAAHTSAAASGGTVNNYGVNLTLSTGSGAGTTSNYGLRITGNGGTGGAGTTNNFAIFSDSTAASSLAGTLSATRYTSTISTGTAPLVVASTTNVANLNASSLSGATFAAPGAIGGGSPSAITGTTIVANTSLSTSSIINTSGAITVTSSNSILQNSNAGNPIIANVNSSGGVDLKNSGIGGGSGNFAFAFYSDNYSGQTLGYTMSRGTTYNVASHVWSTSTVAGTPVTGAVLDTANFTLSRQLFINSMTQTAVAQSGTVCYNSGTGAITYDSTVGCLTSSARFKDNIQSFSSISSLSKVMALRPVTFHYKPGITPDHSEQFGLIAEEVAKVDPRLVGFDNEGRPRGVRYSESVAVLIGAIQAQQHQIDSLRQELKSLHPATRASFRPSASPATLH